MTELVVIGILCLSLGFVLGYFSWKWRQLSKKVDRLIWMVGDAGPGLSRKISEQGTEVVLNIDRWIPDDEYFIEERR